MATKFHHYYTIYVRKDGKPGRKLIDNYAEYTPLFCCDVCNALGPAAKVTFRSDVHLWNREHPDDYDTPSKDTLCVGCWNRARAVKARQRAIEQNKSLINRIKKEIANGRKQRKQDGSDHGRPAGLPGEHDGRREERHA